MKVTTTVEQLSDLAVEYQSDVQPRDVREFLEEIRADYSARFEAIDRQLKERTKDRFMGEDFERFHKTEFQELKDEIKKLETKLKVDQ